MFTCVRGGCDNHRCHNKNSRKDGLRIFGFEKNSELRFGLGRSESIFGARRGQTSSLRRGAARGEVRWKSQHCKKLCLSPLMS